MYTAVPHSSRNRSNEKAKSCGFIIFSFLFYLCDGCCVNHVHHPSNTRSSEIHKTFGFIHFPLLVVLGCCTWLSEVSTPQLHPPSKNRSYEKLRPSVWPFSASCSYLVDELYLQRPETSNNRSSEIHKTCGFTHFPLLVVLVSCPCDRVWYVHTQLTSGYKGHPSRPSVCSECPWNPESVVCACIIGPFGRDYSHSPPSSKSQHRFRPRRPSVVELESMLAFDAGGECSNRSLGSSF